MKIVIVGNGKVGSVLAERLVKENHDIVIIDKQEKSLTMLQETLDVLGVVGNGASLEVQREAGVASADLLIAVTGRDEVNLLCCMIARKLGSKHTIARVRNPEYAPMSQFLRTELGLSMSINPEKTAAVEIFRLLQLPSFLKRDSFVNGRVELVEISVKEGSKLDGARLDKLKELTKMNTLVCAVKRGDQITIPSGNFTLLAGDSVTLAAAASDLALLIKGLDMDTQKVRNVIIIGGGTIAEYLAEQLIRSRVSVKIIESDAARCYELSDQFPNAIIINGDGTQQELLAEEGIKEADAVVTLTGIDEENLVVSMYANYIGVPKAIAKINRLEFSAMLRDKGLDSVISPKVLTANEITRYVRFMSNSSGGAVKTLHRIVDDRVEAMEFEATASTKNLDVPLYKIRLKPNILIACIGRGTGIIIPKGQDRIKKGDAVIVVTTSDMALTDLNDIFSSENDLTGEA